MITLNRLFLLNNKLTRPSDTSVHFHFYVIYADGYITIFARTAGKSAVRLEAEDVVPESIEQSDNI